MSISVVTDEKMDQETAGQFVIQDQLPPDDSSATPTPVLADHMDMARPPHENPEYGSDILPAPSPTYTTIISPGPMGQSLHAVPIAIPITTFTIANTNVSSTKIEITWKPKYLLFSHCPVVFLFVIFQHHRLSGNFNIKTSKSN